MKKNNVKNLAQKYEQFKTRFNKHSSLQITDNNEIIADGCKRIISCDENLIIINQIKGRVVITGFDMQLKNWGSDGVTITGSFKSIEWETL